MRIHDIKHFITSHVITAHYEKTASIPVNARVYLKYDTRSFTIYTTNRQLVKLTVDDVTHFEFLKRLLTTNNNYVAAVLDHDSTNKKYHFVVKQYENNRPLSFKLAFQDEFLNKKNKKQKDEALIREYQNKYLVNDGESQLGVIAVHQKSISHELRNFYLVGIEDYLQVQVEKLEDGKEIFKVKNSGRIKTEDYRFFLVEGEIDFVLDSEEAELDLQAKMFFEQMKNDTKAYINIWNDYGKLEFEQMLNELTSIGYLQFANCEHVGQNVHKLTFDSQQAFQKFASRLGKKHDHFSLSTISPKEVFEIDDSHNEFIDRYRQYAFEPKVVQCSLANPIDAKSNVIYITTEENINRLANGGYIFISIAGYISMNNRRREAYDRIFNGKSGISSISALIDGKAFPSKPKHRDYLNPLSELVIQKAFPKNPPTDKQREAIEVALNTPDIALIQGPPGTGKTTVIVGILERLNELAEGEERRKAKNLVTAFQHDAVQNVAERVQILDLPTIKFGSRSSDTLDAKRILKMIVENWINEKVNQLYEAYPTYKENRKIQEFDRIYHNYLMTANTVDESIRLLSELYDALRFDLSVELEQELARLLKLIKKNQDYYLEPERRRLIQKVAALPDHKVKYADNGEYTVNLVIRLLESEFNDMFVEYIKFLKYFLAQEKKPFKTMYDARRKLLLELKPTQNIFNTPKQRSDILDLFTRISEYLKDSLLASYEEEDRILLDYIEEYELNPIAVQNTIINYMSVVGATNQQSVGRDVKNIVTGGVDNKSEVLTYDNVIIDEAARSNPLDLFIPMSRANRRIILVGDHRQLPHIVDDKLVKMIENDQTVKVNHKIESDSAEEIKEKLQLSLFETLFKKLKEQETKDGIKRTVTLDRQYRTHPLLGDFISKNFYEIHDEAQIASGLGAELFQHRLIGLENKAAVWMDIPHKEGEEISSQSKKRPIEAKRIVAHLKEMIHSDRAKGLNFGIITFYADQVKAIYEELVKQDMARRVGKSYELLPEYSEEFHNGRSIEKLRIGTVDAFQGMEFDFVYLSMVRSNTLPDTTDKQRQRKYGFLMMENRLCVSMSRQKKMLIVVGDESMLRSPNAHLAIQPLINFYDYCVKDETYGKKL